MSEAFILVSTRLESLATILSPSSTDDISPALATLLDHDRAEDVLRLAYEKLHTFPFSEVPLEWRRAYEEASVSKAISILRRAARSASGDAASDGTEVGDWVGEVVRVLDMAIIMTGAPRRGSDIERLYKALATQSLDLELSGMQDVADTMDGERPNKRRKVTSDVEALPETWPTETTANPPLRFPVARRESLGASAFQQYLDSGASSGLEPLVITGALEHWPALASTTPERNWDSPAYLWKRTLGGRRLIPIEIGRSYTDKGWTQKITTIGDFMRQQMLAPSNPTTETSMHDRRKIEKAYLAQYDIFAQLPDLRSDIAIPDYCYTSPPRPATDIKKSSSNDDDDDYGDGSEPQLNSWFGPANTISPAHTDPHHNILAQVVGHKYIRLFAPSESAKLHPRSTSEDGIDMSNTSQVDVGLAMKILEGWDWGDGVDGEEVERGGFDEKFPLFEGAAFQEAVIGPGDCLYIPRGWWHYVRSLSTSFSVSFWWD